jgi:hypothetical protein
VKQFFSYVWVLLVQFQKEYGGRVNAKSVAHIGILNMDNCIVLVEQQQWSYISFYVKILLV